MDDSKPIIELTLNLSYNPSKNYIFNLLCQHIQTVEPQRSLDAAIGELRNFWMFRGKYVGITINSAQFFRGLETPPNPKLIRKRGFPEVYMTRMESDFSFLGSFDLCVSTFTLGYVQNSADAISRLSNRVTLGGSLIVEAMIKDADYCIQAIAPQYQFFDLVYWGLPQCNQVREGLEPSALAELSQMEMQAKNVRGAHERIYLFASGKKSPATQSSPMPEIIDDRGLKIVKSEIPYLQMTD